MSDYREGCIKAKAVKRGIIDQRPVSGKANKKKREHIVEFRYTKGEPAYDLLKLNGKWHNWKAYLTPEDAMQALEGFRRKYPWREYRLQPKEEK